MELIKRIKSSPYLSGILIRHPELAAYASGELNVDQVVLQAQLDALDQMDEQQLVQTERCSDQLRMIKQRFSLLWSIADLSGSLEFAALSAAQSRFADRSIQCALNIVWRSEKISRLFANPDKLPASESGIFILALGKLGGNDLNFSSDVDLVAFYDNKLLKAAPMYGASHAVTECLKSLTSLLTRETVHGFVWRVDWRLRPYASLRKLSMVSEKALDFYHYSARPWHRLAMIKARPVAGNIDLGSAFMFNLGAFLWRHNLDYRAIDDIASLKSKINLEHPSLAKQRQLDEIRLDEGRGMNLKLGHGGIREIEFIVNAKQLIWGGRKPGLRTSNTLKALEILWEEGLLSREDGKGLKRAYVFLRQAENRLQMRDNAQVYHLPVDEPELTAYLTLHGEKDWQNFNQVLSEHRKRVDTVFSSLFNDGENAEVRQAGYDWQAEGLTKNAQDIVEDWMNGFQCYGMMQGQAHQFDSLLDALGHEIVSSGVDTSEAIVQIDDYFKRLPPGGQYFRLLRDFPWLLEKLIAPVLLSPTMTSLLQQSPHIIDRYLEHQTSVDDELDTTIVFSISDYEQRLENLRRVANEELYLRYSYYFEAKIEPRAFQQQLTHLAEQLLTASVQVACDEMLLETPPVSVIGFGKLGSRGMMPKSDLDLVYLCDSMENHVLSSQFASRLNTVINTPMREGRVYELDTRLRPSGQSGSVTISLNSYRQHQLDRAHTWSHLALVSARSVAGDTAIGDQFHQIKSEILNRPRDITQFKYDCAKMLQRVRDQRIEPAQADQFTVKHRPGGLFELEYLLSCMAILACIDKPELSALEYDERIRELVRPYGDELSGALECLRNFQLEIRLFGHDGERFSELPEPILRHFLGVMNCPDTEALVEKIEQSLRTCRVLTDEFFSGVEWAKLPDWKEVAVVWV